jgi:uncharacterized membrane protein
MAAKISFKVLTAVVLAALYAALVIALPSISYGPIQVRVADILSPLPYVMGFESVIGLTLGTLIANAFSPYGIWDMTIGTLCTFTYTLIDWALGRKVGYRKWMLPVVAVVNSLIVGLYIGYILLGTVAGAGDPVELFVFLTAESLIPMAIGSLVVVPVVKRYLRYR